MNDAFFLRPARTDDLPRIASIESAVFATPYSEDALSSMMSTSYHRVIVLVDQNDVVVGYLLGTSIPPEGELMRVAVTPNRRRMGGGAKLIRAFLEKLSEEGNTVCFLDVRESNLPAQSLYASFGFQAVGRRAAYYRLPTEDAIEMSCPLSPHRL